MDIDAVSAVFPAGHRSQAARSWTAAELIGVAQPVSGPNPAAAIAVPRKRRRFIAELDAIICREVGVWSGAIPAPIAESMAGRAGW